MTPREAQDGSGGAAGGSAVHGEGSGRQAGAEGVTEADREWAARLVPYSMAISHPISYARCVRAIAAALAEERAKARAPFLRLASEFGSWPSARILSPHDAGDRIRQAAKEIE